MRIRMSVLLIACVLLAPLSHELPANAAQEGDRFERLEQVLDGLRQQLKIPAMSCAIVKAQKVVWAKGFGYADLENKIPATEHTPYHLASLTKTFASTIVMQLVQEGKVKLDDPVSKYGILLESDGVIRVKHLLSHTSEGNPGERYSYNGNRFGELDKVIRKATGKTFAELLIANILDPLALNETAPNVWPVARTSSPNPADQKSEAEVKAAVNGLIAAFNSSSIDEIERYLAPQQNAFRRDGGLLAPFTDTAALRNDLRAGVKINLQVHDLEAAVYGDAALATCIMTQAVTLPNGRVRDDGSLRTSMVWNRQGGAWKLVHAHQSALTDSQINDKQRQRFDAVSKTIAQPYELDAKSNIVKSKYPTHFSTAAGLISSVFDMAKYDIAIDQNRFLSKETQQLAFTPMVSTSGDKLPYGLGWFTQNYKGTRLIWHYGYWTCNSSLIVKVPDRNITFIAMANTDNLSRPTDLGAGDVTSSPVALAFLKTFIFPEVFGESPPEINWGVSIEELKQQLKRFDGKPYADLVKTELMVRSRINASVGKANESAPLFKAYGELYSKPLPDGLSSRSPIAEIIRVADDADRILAFDLQREQDLRVFATGEGQNGEMFDYGWIEDETGRRLWEMKMSDTKHAGGAQKNRVVETTVKLPPGRYKLRYKSDDSHSFENWNALPPDVNFWGIALYAK